MAGGDLVPFRHQTFTLDATRSRGHFLCADATIPVLGGPDIGLRQPVGERKNTPPLPKGTLLFIGSLTTHRGVRSRAHPDVTRPSLVRLRSVRAQADNWVDQRQLTHPLEQATVPSVPLHKLQRERDHELPHVIQHEVGHAPGKALLGPKGVEDQEDVTRQEEQRAAEEHRRIGAGL